MKYTIIILIFSGLMVAEVIYVLATKKDSFDWKDFGANWAMYLGYFLVNHLWIPCTFAIYTFSHRFAPFHFGEQWWKFRDKNFPLVCVSLVFAEDFCFHIYHRASHKIRFLWASHVTHHSSTQYNLSVGVRQNWAPFFGVIFWIPLALIGYDPLLILTFQFNSMIYQAFLHSQFVGKLGPLEWIFNTPSHHRVHHGAQNQYLNRNFGGVFIVWDRIFGTFREEIDKPTFGLVKNIESYNPFVIAFHEWSVLLRELVKKVS